MSVHVCVCECLCVCVCMNLCMCSHGLFTCAHAGLHLEIDPRGAR